MARASRCHQFTRVLYHYDQLPPRFLLAVLPTLVLISVLFSLQNGRKWLSELDIKMLTYLHVVRVPVELVLLGLYFSGGVPQIMTFEGRNFDILSGITAPFIVHYGIIQQRLSPILMLLWNIVCLLLLLNIVSIAILSAPFPFQQYSFDQPNIAILYFPFIWLPACIVPLVLFSHLVCIRFYCKEIITNKLQSNSFHY